jgi:hypothetical protein
MENGGSGPGGLSWYLSTFDELWNCGLMGLKWGSSELWELPRKDSGAAEAIPSLP